MKKVFVSTGFSGRSINDIVEDLMRAEEICQSFYNEFVMIITNYYYTGNHQIVTAFEKMKNCDAVIFMKNWVYYEGCRREMTFLKNHNTVITNKGETDKTISIFMEEDM